MKRKIIPLLLLGIMLPMLIIQVDAVLFPSVKGYVKDINGARISGAKVTMTYNGIYQDSCETNSDGEYSVRINEPIFGSTKLRVLVKYEADKFQTRTLGLLLGKYGVYKVVTLYEPIDETPPAQVTGLTATALSDTEIRLSWDENTESDFSYYNIYRSDLDGARLDYCFGESYTDSELFPETTYTYQVTAVDKLVNEGTPSDPASATTEMDATPRSYAIIIGIGTYQDSSEFTETYGDNDADMWDDLFTLIGYTHITVLKNSQATESNIETAIDDIANIMRDQDKLAIIFSGHGGYDSYGQWFYTYESDAETTGMFCDDELAGLLNGMDASQLFIFMRSCYSGGFASEIINLGFSFTVYISTACHTTGVSWNCEVAGEYCGGWTYYLLYYANAYFDSNDEVYFNDEIIGAAEYAYIEEIGNNTGYETDDNPYHISGSTITL
jgi:hypothetical protein